MSAICLIVLKEPNLEFDEFNELSKKLVRFAVDNNLAVFFQNSYFPDLFSKDNFNQFFFMSDSFLYQNCDFLTTEGIGYKGVDIFRKEFMNKFGFFNTIFSIVFNYVKSFDVYITGGGVSTLEDFDIMQTTESDFLQDLFKCILDRSDEYAYGFPTIKFEVSRYSDKS